MNEAEKELELNWQRMLFKLKADFGKKPDLQSLLFLIGIQELGELHRTFTKEEKQDLMHIAVCMLLSKEGYYNLIGLDEDGWPHYEQTTKEMPQGLKGQEQVLKRQIINYIN